MPDLSRTNYMAACNIQSQQYAFPIAWRASGNGVQSMSHQQSVSGFAHHMCGLPSHRFQRHNKPESRCGQLSERMPNVSCANSLAASHIQSLSDELPTDGRPYCNSVSAMPCKQQLSVAVHKLLSLPHGAVCSANEPKPRNFAIQSRLHALPHDNCVASIDVQS